MSAEATGWVFRYSPYTGAVLVVHLALADSVNDQHGHEFWLGQSQLAEKARTSRETTNRILARLVEEGMIEDLGSEPGRNRVRRFRFLFPDLPVTYDTRKRRQVVTRDHNRPVTRDHNSDGQVVTRDHTGCDERSHVLVSKEVEPKRNPRKKLSDPALRAGSAPDPMESPYWRDNRALWAHLERLNAPAELRDPALCVRLDELTSGSPVAWDNELARYLTWLELQPPSSRHKNLPRGFLRWVNREMAKVEWATRRTNGTRAVGRR